MERAWSGHGAGTHFSPPLFAPTPKPQQDARPSSTSAPASVPAPSLTGEPTTAQPSLTETWCPDMSYSSPSAAASSACCAQEVPLRVKTYAEPESVPWSSSRWAPSRAELPSMDTAAPNKSRSLPVLVPRRGENAPAVSLPRWEAPRRRDSSALTTHDRSSTKPSPFRRAATRLRPYKPALDFPAAKLKAGRRHGPSVPGTTSQADEAGLPAFGG